MVEDRPVERLGTIPAGAGSRAAPARTRSSQRDHPRGCGEQLTRPYPAVWDLGPSPRVRGAADAGGPGAAYRGTIPAGAGSSSHWRALRARCRDHPRGCGEQRELCTRGAPSGPPPRVRGAVDQLAGRRGGLGTIPADAGSTGRDRERDGHLRDHPRGCGEQYAGGRILSWSPEPSPGCGEQVAEAVQTAVMAGPSPRVREAVGEAAQVLPRGGTIPAGAGSRLAVMCWWCLSGDHPRGCGEQAEERGRALRAEGPSPGMWGAVHPGRQQRRHLGTIPAGAGSSGRSCSLLWWAGDHPRGCGEQQTRVPGEALHAGPSPRVRGAGAQPGPPAPRAGTIPAGAGSSGPWCGPRPPAWDHPRGCGEQPIVTVESALDMGPSPRVRGADLLRPHPCLHRGTIPAGAGSRRDRCTAGRPGWDHPRGCGEQW